MFNYQTLNTEVGEISRTLAENPDKLQTLLQDVIGWTCKLNEYGNGYEGLCPECHCANIVLRFDTQSKLCVRVADICPNKCLTNNRHYPANIIGFTRFAYCDYAAERAVLSGIYNAVECPHLKVNHFRYPFNRMLYLLFSDHPRMNNDELAVMLSGHSNANVEHVKSVIGLRLTEEKVKILATRLIKGLSLTDAVEKVRRAVR